MEEVADIVTFGVLTMKKTTRLCTKTLLSAASSQVDSAKSKPEEQPSANMAIRSNRTF